MEPCTALPETPAPSSLLARRRSAGRPLPPAMNVTAPVLPLSGQPLGTAEDLSSDDHFHEEADRLFASATRALHASAGAAAPAGPDTAWVARELALFMQDLSVADAPPAAPAAAQGLPPPAPALVMRSPALCAKYTTADR